MSTLTIRLAGPLQSWGTSSRFVRRETDPHPSKSGVVGMLAAALGYRRTDSLEDLLGLAFGVRIDHPGEIVRDFQTARSLDGKDPMPLSYRFYLSDAVFHAAVEGPDDLIETLDAALQAPKYPLYLGRRSCPPAGPLRTTVSDGSVFEALQAAPWRPRTRATGPVVRLEVLVDASAAPEHARATGVVESVRDHPVSFDPELRQYGWRKVVRTWVDVPGLPSPVDSAPSVATSAKGSRAPRDQFHDAFAITGG